MPRTLGNYGVEDYDHRQLAFPHSSKRWLHGNRDPIIDRDGRYVESKEKQCQIYPLPVLDRLEKITPSPVSQCHRGDGYSLLTGSRPTSEEPAHHYPNQGQ